MPTNSAPPKRKINVNYVKNRESNKESFISCSWLLINHTMKMTKENDKIRVLMDEMLHSIFFLGYIHMSTDFSPSKLFRDEVQKECMEMFPGPFEMYKSLPTRTPFSILLNMMEDLYETEENIIKNLLVLLKKMKFPYPLQQPGSKHEQFYTLESFVICVCYSDTNPQRKYYGASLSCRKGNAKAILIDLSCLNTWHEYVSHAVMSFTSGVPCDGIKFPESVKCQAYYRDWTNNVYIERKPCSNCNKLFNLEDADLDKVEFPYGNCAETEGLSKLLINDQVTRENTWIENRTEESLERLRYETKARLKKSLNQNSENFLFYTPMQI